MNLASLKNKTTASIFSLYFLQITDRILQAAISLVLIRILRPEDVGLFAVLFAIFNILTMLIPAGQGPLFIRKREYSAWELIQVVFINTILCVVILEIVADTFSLLNPKIPQMARIFFIALIPGCMNMAFISMASKEMENYKLLFPTIVGTITYGILVIIFALAGFKVYSFIYAIMVSTTAYSLICSIIFRKRIVAAGLLSVKNYLTYLKEGLTFNILHVFGVIGSQVDRIILTRFTTMNSLGVYSVAANSLGKVNSFFIGGMQSVIYPLYSKLTDNIEKIKGIYSDFTKVMFAVLIPLNTFIFVFAKDIVLFIGKEKWLGAVPFISAFSFLYLLSLVTCFGYQLLWVQKKEKYTVFQQAARLVILITAGPILARFLGIYAFIILYFIMGFCESIYYYILLKPLRKQIHENFIFVLKLFCPIFILTNVIGKFGTFSYGAIFLIASYIIIGYFIFIPFIKRRFGMDFKTALRMIRDKLKGQTGKV